MTYARDQLAKAREVADEATADLLLAGCFGDEVALSKCAARYLRAMNQLAERCAAVEAEDRSYRETYPTNPATPKVEA